MKAINKIFLSLFLLALNAQAEIALSKLVQAPREFFVGMAERTLLDQKDGLFPGPSVRLESSAYSFKTFMEIDGMGSPGHQSFYYLFEDNKLQGVIQTTSLLGLVEDEARRIATFNYNKVLEAVSGQSEISEILRKDGESFSRVTLEKWNINNESINVFHVATNYESSVGVLSSDTHFPTAQLFIAGTDQRFQDQIKNEATIVDTPRGELLKVTSMRLTDRKREGRELGPSNLQEKVNHHEPAQSESNTSSIQDSNEHAAPYLKWILITCISLGMIYVFWKIRKSRE
jgi:hypothetical protein